MGKQRYAVFRSGFTGRRFVVDLWRKRLNDLRKKLQAWSVAVSPVWHRKGVKKCMITLTYDTNGLLFQPSEWSPNHITNYLKALRRRSGLEVLAYAWVVEVQKRGVPHYHIILLYKGSVPYPDRSGMWRYGLSTLTLKIRSAFYLVRYTGKEYQKDFSRLPNGARAYAVSISNPELRKKMRAELLPEHIRERYLVEGPEVLADLQRPSWLRSEYIGSAVTFDYASYLADEVDIEL